MTRVKRRALTTTVGVPRRWGRGMTLDPPDSCDPDELRGLLVS